MRYATRYALLVVSLSTGFITGCGYGGEQPQQTFADYEVRVRELDMEAIAFAEANWEKYPIEPNGVPSTGTHTLGEYLSAVHTSLQPETYGLTGEELINAELLGCMRAARVQQRRFCSDGRTWVGDILKGFKLFSLKIDNGAVTVDGPSAVKLASNVNEITKLQYLMQEHRQYTCYTTGRCVTVYGLIDCGRELTADQREVNEDCKKIKLYDPSGDFVKLVRMIDSTLASTPDHALSDAQVKAVADAIGQVYKKVEEKTKETRDEQAKTDTTRTDSINTPMDTAEATADEQ